MRISLYLPMAKSSIWLNVREPCSYRIDRANLTHNAPGIGVFPGVLEPYLTFTTYNITSSTLLQGGCRQG